jgi:hypothetical protein
VWEVFTRYITGEPNSNGVKIKQTPWCDEQLNTETSLITDSLAKGNVHHTHVTFLLLSLAFFSKPGGKVVFFG